MKKRYFGLIMAGGQGTRFWPHSTEEVPKQFLNIVENQPLILQTYNRLKRFIRPESIYIVADKKYLALTKKSLPGFRESNYIVEPCPKNTAPCLILANIVLSRIDEDANILVVPADHYIPDGEIFRRQMQDALEFAHNRTMITAGVKPHMAHTGYGYICFDKLKSERLNQTDFFRVKKFKEKPKLPQARRYLKQGNYYWNSGMFIYKLKFFREFLRQYNSYYADQYNKLDKTWGHAQKFSGIFKQIIPESIDFALMEKVMEMRMFPARFAWNDVGSWSSVFELNKKDRDGNVKVGRHAAFDTNHSLLFSTEGLPIAAIGLDQMVVVHTKNGILVAPMDELERVRDAITKLK